MALPEPIRRRLRTTNALERLNREIRRREKAVGIFPNEEAALRLLGAVLMEIDEAWATGRATWTWRSTWHGWTNRKKLR
jgi:transposase-like protein